MGDGCTHTNIQAPSFTYKCFICTVLFTIQTVMFSHVHPAVVMTFVVNGLMEFPPLVKKKIEMPPQARSQINNLFSKQPLQCVFYVCLYVYVLSRHNSPFFFLPLQFYLIFYSFHSVTLKCPSTVLIRWYELHLSPRKMPPAKKIWN